MSSVTTLSEYAERLQRLEAKSAPAVAATPTVIVERGAAPAPHAWRFTVERGPDNLITEIIATPE